MDNSDWLTRKLIAGCLAVLMATASANAAPASGQETTRVQQVQSGSSAGEREFASSDATGKLRVDAAESKPALPDAPSAAPSESSNRGEAAEGSQAGQSQDQSSQTKPVGTAAAPAEPAVGVAASKPAGAAIAPAKQRRVRIFLIRVAVVVGACVAVGTVVALSHSSPSEPRP
jgi:hypothetical protein